MTTVPIREMGKGFERIRKRAVGGPVALTEEGRTTAYVVAADEFERMWACYRRSLRADELTDEEMNAIIDARVPSHLDWDHEGPLSDR